MNIFKDRVARLGIRARLLGGISAVLSLIVVLTAVGIDQVNRIDRNLTTINDINGVKMRHAIDWRGSVHDRAILLRDLTLVTRPDELQRIQAHFRRLVDDYRNASQGMREVIAANGANEQENRLLATIERQAERTDALASDIIAERDRGNIEAARRILLAEAGPAFFQWLDDINAFIDYQEAETARDTAGARDTASGFQALMLGLCLAALLIGGLIAILLSRQLLRELGAEPHEVKAFAEAIGRGELAVEGKQRHGDRHSIMAAQVAMARQLQGIVAQVRAAADSVAGNSEQIAAGNGHLASRTEQQASALSQTASAMEELNTTVAQNADNADRTSREAEEAATTAIQGGQAVQQVTQTMRELEESAGEIADIISTIDDIAFQTNILALNASVEAARAGEHGRGFAVVAAEVRTLAQNSATAAREVSDRINRNAERVKHGNARAAEANQAAEEVVASIRRVSRFMQAVNEASMEQRAGVQEAGTAVTQMDRVTQQNAALVQESATAADNLRQHAERLMAAMSAFRLPDASHRSQVTAHDGTARPAEPSPAVPSLPPRSPRASTPACV
ncbi:methyl-accepting chemotaxis protein [Halomonas beimenensis]|uniref:Methyl-accepting chemotaxis protein I (Serine chemoreceptor protein) n=1 Tax=Halomonas beimenensis TaxID=475662 RepID=A0A291P5H6_9GAMM|nr:methyl-accepting chemotaxis protein [Halomonas beimenensis]ATJ82136.1 methyl-accepting chemotaxis protein I (serine chemoreceptor protein) [Halomonas beimenensis]